MSIDPRALAKALPRLAAVALVALAAPACRQGMYDQARYEPFEASEIFADGSAARPLPEHTVAWGHLRDDETLFTGLDSTGAYAPSFPMKVDRPFLERGQERFEIFCSPCHGRTGQGDGMIVRRGYPQPVSFHDARVRQMPAGYYVNVITQGFGRMPFYASQVPAEDRWAIAAYLRALQLAGSASMADLGPEDRARLPQIPRSPTVPLDPAPRDGSEAPTTSEEP